jgi:hypothetical protein
MGGQSSGESAAVGRDAHDPPPIHRVVEHLGMNRDQVPESIPGTFRVGAQLDQAMDLVAWVS